MSLGPGAADYQGDSVFERKALTIAFSFSL